jgi:DNA-binding CsgD family transcriptional regulator
MANQFRPLLYYGALLAAMLFFLNWLEFRLLIIQSSFEIYAGIIAFTFTLLGIWLARRLTTPKKETIIVEKVVADTQFQFNIEECNRRNISKRELEVLELMSQGLSNAEIAARLFVSTNTIKTHVSKLLEKLEVNRRTQAIAKSKELGLIK